MSLKILYENHGIEKLLEKLLYSMMRYGNFFGVDNTYFSLG